MEYQRIDFLLRRDGLKKTRDFCTQTINQYRKALRMNQYKGKWENLDNSIGILSVFMENTA